MKKKMFIAAMGIASLTPGCVKTGSVDVKPTEPQPSGEVSSKKLDVDRLLKRLAENPAPQKLNFGAMCYKMALPPERVDYVCPSCGTKTIHALRDNHQGSGWDAPALSVPHYRKYVEQLNSLGLAVKLDESFLCSACNKEKKSSLYLEVTLKSKVVRTALRDMDDLRKLVAFLQGDLIWKGDRDEEHPLKPELPRIRQLLGIKQ